MTLAKLLHRPWFSPPTDPIEVDEIRVDDTTTPRQLTLRTIWSPRRFLIPAALLVIVHQLGEAMVPILAGLAIDNAVRGSDGGQLVLWLVLLALNFGILSMGYRFGSRIGFYGMQAVRQQLRVRVAARLLDARGNSAGDRMPGVSLSIANSDVDRVTMAVALGLYPVGELVAVIFAGSVLLFISWPLGLFVLLGVPALLWVLDRAGEPLRKRSGHEQELAASAAGRAADLMSGYRIIKGMRGERPAENRYRTVSQDALGATLQARQAFGGYLGLTNLATGLFIAIVGTAAGVLTVNGDMSIAELVTVAGLTQFLMGPVGALGANFGLFWSRSIASAARVLMILQDKPQHYGQARGDDGRPQELELSGVRTSALPDVDLGVSPGEFVVVRTDSSSGGELFDVLAAAPPEAGQVRYGGTSLTELDPRWLRAQVLASAHEARLFPGSILDNVTLDRCSESAARSALEAAGCADLIDGLAAGADSEVGEQGGQLSGGQRQRVALARALAQDSPVLVLHDPTTAVDSVTETLVAERVRQYREGRTTIVIGDSPAFRAVADRVVEIAGSEASA